MLDFCGVVLLSCGVSFCPLPGYSIVLFSVIDILCCDATNQRIGWITVGEKWTNGEENFGNGKSWTPTVFKNVQTDHALAVDVTVVYSGAERYLWGFKRIIRWKMDIKEKDSSFVHWFRRTKDCRVPFVKIVTFGSSAAIWWRIQSDLGQFSLNSEIQYRKDYL